MSIDGGVMSSVPVNSNSTALELLGGAIKSEVSGGVTSWDSMTPHSYSDASTCSMPLESVAITRSMWSPGSSASYLTGGVHGRNGSRSSEQTYVASATFASKSMIAVVDSVSLPVAGSSGVSGGVKPVDSGFGPGRKTVCTPSSVQV